MRYQNASELIEHREILEPIKSWIHEAGNPYFDWFFGGPDQASRVLDRWMSSDGSECALQRTQVLVLDDRPIGCMIGIGGRELATCRRANMMLILKDRRIASDESLHDRMSSAADLFPPVAPDEFYLSKIGIEPAERGRGFGKMILERFIRDGAKAGYTRFKLDVWVGNQAAVQMYEKAGFHISTRSSVAGTNLEYLSMTR